MADKSTKPVAKSPKLYYGTKVPMRVIRRYALQVAERFQPDQIILFGSYAYGTPHDESDVDLLVVMPCRNELDQSVKISWELEAPFSEAELEALKETRPVKISWELEAPFSLDLIVRTPKNMAWRLKEGDWFLREVVARGKILYAKADS